jgi:tellurite resistance protein
MEFRPFWELLAEMGIALPDPSKARGKRRSAGVPMRSTSQGFRSTPRNADEMFEFLEAMLEEGEAGNDDKESDDSDWIPPGQTVKVAGLSIPGMVYVGENLSALRNYGIEPCLIRPSLRVSRKGADYEKQPKSYNLSYTQMQNDGRAAYLRWLAEGRSAPKAYLGYVWLFFYGLERRVLHDLLKADLKTDLAKREELDQIMAEVKRLKEIYGNPTINWSFSNKTEAFLEIGRLLRSQGSPQAELANETAIDLDKAQPFTVQIGLGQMVKRGRPIPADWALVWYTRLANNSLPLAATRCLEEFKTLFQLRYEQKYGEGIKLKAGKVKLKTTYHPSNPSFGRSIEIEVGDLPDISRFTAKLAQIGELVQKCRLELEPLSRLIARNPNARHTPAAIVLLPVDLLETHSGTVVKTLQQWLSKLFAKSETQVAVISGKTLFQHWSGSNPEKLTKSEAVGLSHLLALLSYGMEPDPRFGGALPTVKSSLALFRMPSNHPDVLSDAYREATLWLHLAIATASGDELPSPIERQYLQANLEPMAKLKAPEQKRLNAHFHWLLQEQPTLRNLKTRIETVPMEKRGAIAQFLVRVAAADGQIKPKEVQLLEKAYIQLGLDPQTLYGDIHGLSTDTHPYAAKPTAAKEPVTVRRAASTRGRKIPAATHNGRNGQEHTELDMTLVESKIEESKEISHLLASIFTDEESTTPHKIHPAATKPAAKSTRSRSQSATPSIQEISGLDGAHSELLLTLSKQGLWPREDLAAIAIRLNLMLDGALEVINEVAFDRYDQAVIEGDDPIEVNLDLLQELLA